jgi:ABC-type Na+ efflux pump permease subunit
LVVAYLLAQQGLTLSNGIYTIGESSSSPAIQDSRFNVVIIEPADGILMLNNGNLDAYINGESVYLSNRLRSQYAGGALKQYLGKVELGRLIDNYDINRSFPLRIEVNYLQEPAGTSTAITASTATLTPAQTSAVATPIFTTVPSARQSVPAVAADTSTAVKEQIEEMQSGGSQKFKAQFVSDKEIIVPSLMNPPIPLSQVILAFMYIVPIFFLGIFFNSSFMEEKTNRKLNILMSTPVTPFEIIMGKMLPYAGFSLLMVVAITLFLGGDVLLALAIFIPVIMFIFAIYLMVALVYRTFKDQTFFSMAAVTFVTGYLVLPALFTGINSLSYISPLTLAVQMYRGETFTLSQYLLSTAPMFLVFVLSLFIGVRIFNEEYLMGFGPLYRKVADAIYLAINKNHMYVSITLLSLLLIPVVFMVELIIVILSTMIPVDLPQLTFLAILLVFIVIVEELAKSSGIAVLLEHKNATSTRQILILSFLSAFGFFIGEKALLYLSLSTISNNVLMEAIGSANLLIIPLIAHFVFTAIVCLGTKKFGMKYYPYALIAGSFVHFIYNFYILSMQMGMV